MEINCGPAKELKCSDKGKGLKKEKGGKLFNHIHLLVFSTEDTIVLSFLLILLETPRVRFTDFFKDAFSATENK